MVRLYSKDDVAEFKDQEIRQLRVAVEMLTMELTRANTRLAYLSSRVEMLENRVYTTKGDDY